MYTKCQFTFTDKMQTEVKYELPLHTSTQTYRTNLSLEQTHTLFSAEIATVNSITFF